VEQIVQTSDLLSEIYNAISLKLLSVLDQISTTDLIKVLYELSQKKVIQPFFVKDERIQAFFTKLDYINLSHKNRHDFLSLGHVMHNLAVFISIPSWCVKIYTKVLKEEYQIGSDKQEEGAAWRNEREKVRKPTAGNSSGASLSGANGSKQDVERFHARKVLSKIESREAQRRAIQSNKS
jgi:hypothetical protein